MRLMYFIPLLSTVGGQERTLTDKANFLAGKGHDVMMVTYEHGSGPLAYDLHSSVQHIDVCCHFFRLYKYPVYRRVIEAYRMKKLLRQRMSEVIDQFRPDIIVIAIPNTENFICDVMSVSRGIPIVIESHLAYGHQVVKRGLTEKLLYGFQSPLLAVRRSDLLIALTEGDANCWRKQHVRRVEVVPNPVTYYPPKMPHEEKVEGRILCVGRLTAQKRFDRLVRAFSLLASKYPSWHIDIIGEGEEWLGLMSLIRELDLQGRIIILPPTKEIYQEYSRSQFFVLCSDFEGFGLVIIEAMACGMPVIATDCPYGPSEIIEDGVTGLLAEMNPGDLAQKMEWMMTHDEERKLMGENAYKAVGRYRKETVVEAWEHAYQSVIR